ncbi:hypothetical protein ARMSODRAFT_1007384 [Armillaria solidipes]|uniref:F-box domain-containing protein n=1 Tax=Armillaria solidipes TaxID=1076256 RepID=A0A2H3BLY6_9AGAR|nr:hypothetical protein ARMSODRAFT_1007384 [Armillaria solidipes]
MARRTRRGMLERMLDMHADIWLEVVSYLSPRDVLQLARLSEALYSVFTTRPTSTHLWKAARKSVDCPAPVTGFSELAWADLLYVNKCHFCRKNVARKVEFYFLTRICKACYKEHVIYHRVTDTLTAFIASLVPTAMKGITIQYLQKDFEAVKAKYLSLPDNEKDAYCQERWDYLTEVENFRLIGTAWCEQRTEVRSEELGKKKTERADAITKKLKGLGYGDAFLSDEFCLQFYKHPAVKSSRSLKEQAWSNIRDTIIEMAEGAIKELADKRVARILVVENRIAIATAFLEGPDLSRITKVPSIVDFLAVPCHNTLIKSPVSLTLAERELKPLVDAFRMEWMDQALDELIRVLGKIQPERLTKYQKRAYLELARNVFECRRCSSRGLLFPQVLEHECCIYLRDPRTMGSERRCVWTVEYLSRQEPLMAFMPIFIRAIGLDPDTATVEDIASRDQLYRCLMCREAYHLDGKSKNVYDWRSFIEHMDRHISGGSNVVSYAKYFEIMPLENMEDEPATSNTQNNVARQGCRLPGCQDPKCLLKYLQD